MGGSLEKALSVELLQHARQVSRRREGSKRGFFFSLLVPILFIRFFFFFFSLSWKYSHFSLPCPSGPFNSLLVFVGGLQHSNTIALQGQSFYPFFFPPPSRCLREGGDELRACKRGSGLPCSAGVDLALSLSQPGCMHVEVRQSHRLHPRSWFVGFKVQRPIQRLRLFGPQNERGLLRSVISWERTRSG